MSEPSELATALRDRSREMLERWIAGFERSTLRFRRATGAAAHAAHVTSLLESLGEAAQGGADGLRSGSAATRELERKAAFLGAQLASEGATGFDVAALLLELRDVITVELDPAAATAVARTFEWLTIVALDGFAAAGMQSLREQMSEQLESGTPVVELLPRVPAVLLVGAPPPAVLEALLARAWMLAVSTGAPCLILDCAGLASTGEPAFERAYRSFLAQAGGSALQVLMTSAPRPLRESAARQTSGAGLSFQHFDRLDSAIAHALERSGQLLVRRA